MIRTRQKATRKDTNFRRTVPMLNCPKMVVFFLGVQGTNRVRFRIRVMFRIRVKLEVWARVRVSVSVSVSKCKCKCFMLG